MLTRSRFLATILVVLGLAAPAAAQFSPFYNHLKCYQIKGQVVQKVIVADNQFGRERIVKLVPYLLCAPTHKTCCANPPTTKGCQPVPCDSDKSQFQPAPVDHFKCYKIGVKPCTDAAGTPVDCTTLAPFAKNAIKVDLADQFDDETTFVGKPRLLCTPVKKTVIGTTTTVPTTTTSTSTTIPCHNGAPAGAAPMCAGDCPPGQGLACVYIPTINQCRCEIPCALQADGTCNGFCPNAGDQCLPSANPANPCGCGQPTTTTTTLPPPCHFDPAVNGCTGACPASLPAGTQCSLVAPGKCDCVAPPVCCECPGTPCFNTNGQCPAACTTSPNSTCNASGHCGCGFCRDAAGCTSLPCSTSQPCPTGSVCDPINCPAPCDPCAGQAVPCNPTPCLRPDGTTSQCRQQVGQSSCTCCGPTGAFCTTDFDCCSLICNVSANTCQ